MSSKKTKKNSRRWTQEETELFAQILSDPDNGFAESLERLALKKSSNNEVFMYIQQEFVKALKLDPFKEMNEKNFQDKSGNILEHAELDTSIEKLRVKYKTLKQEWNKITDRIKNGSGLSPDKEPGWFKHLNQVFSEANEDIILSSTAADTSFVRNSRREENSDDDGERSSDNEDQLSSEDEAHVDKEIEEPPQKKKIVVAPHKKSKQIRSNKQALSEIAQSLKSFSDAQSKRHQKSLEEERKREERFLEFKRDEAEKDRQHELRVAQMFAANMYQPRPFLYQSQTSRQIAPSSTQNLSTSAYQGNQVSPTYYPTQSSTSNTRWGSMGLNGYPYNKE